MRCTVSGLADQVELRCRSGVSRRDRAAFPVRFHRLQGVCWFMHMYMFVINDIPPSASP